MKVRKFVYCGAMVTCSLLVGKSIFAFSIETDEKKYYKVEVPRVGALGNVSLEYQKEYSWHKISTPDINGKTVYSSIEKAYLYKCEKKASALLEDLDYSFHTFNAGSSMSLTYQDSKVYGSTYSTQVEQTISKSTGKTIGISVGYGPVKAEGSTTSLNQVGLSNSITKSYEYSKTSGTAITANYVVNDSGIYRLGRRAIFDVYILQKIVDVYDITYLYKGKTRYANSTFNYCTIDTSYILNYVSGSIYEGLFKYNSENGKYILDQNYANQYFPNDSVVYLD